MAIVHEMKTPAEMTDEELNAVIPVEVMGWRKMQTWVGGELVFWEDCDNVMHPLDWSPATEYGPAIEVAERMRVRGYDITISILSGGRSHANVQHEDHTKWYGAAWHQHPSRAICEAALQAKRSET